MPQSDDRSAHAVALLERIERDGQPVVQKEFPDTNPPDKHETLAAYNSAYGLDLQYVDGLQNLTAPTDSGRYVPRWAVTFHLGFKRTLKIDQDGFRFVEVDLANVDVKFKPKEKQ